MAVGDGVAPSAAAAWLAAEGSGACRGLADSRGGVAVMAAAIGLGVALASSAPPAGDGTVATGGYIEAVTGYPMPAPITAATPRAARWPEALAAVGAVGLAGVGLTLLHPNVAVTALILLAVLTAVTGAPRWRQRP